MISLLQQSLIFNKISKDISPSYSLVSLARVREKVNTLEELKKYVKNYPPYYYIHFTDDAKFWGPNVKQEWATPLGIYTYPLTPVVYR